MSAVPPELPASARKQKTIFHCAASACLCSPFILFAMFGLMMGAQSLSPKRAHTIALASAAIGVIIPWTGIALGVFSWFGIPRYGRRGILWKSLAGIGIYVLLTIALVPSLVRAKAIVKRRHEQKMNRQPANSEHP